MRRWIGRPALARWMDWYHEDYSASDAAAWVHRCVAQRAAGAALHFAICDADGSLLGVISLEDLDRSTERATLGYWVATPATGRGVATAAVGRCLAWAAVNTDVRCVRALIAPDNVASRRVAEANGFQVAPEGAHPSAEGQLTYERLLTRHSVA
jgi:ribosomal-protein-serine acetyltransferase